MENKKNHRIMRWVALFSVIINVAFNYLYQILPISGSPIDVVTDRYYSLFTPAGYAFAIWGIIYLTFLVYAIYQLLPSQKADAVYDDIAFPFTVSNLLAMIWIGAFSNDHIGSSVIIIGLMVLSGGIMFGKASSAYLFHNARFWITIPFALFVGWGIGSNYFKCIYPAGIA